jgi:ribosomal protein S18 acetylase RimI-like enzyme
MGITLLEDRDRIEAFLRLEAGLHVYELGDLDDSLWPHASFFALEESGEIRAVALVYNGLSVPVLLALTGQDGIEDACRLVRELAPQLPERFHCHLSPGVGEALSPRYHLTSHGEHLKMVLSRPELASGADDGGAARLSPADADELFAFYEHCYPAHSFEPGLLDAGVYHGIRGPHGLIAAAGTHFYSEQYGVAALGNIAVHPAFRRAGYGRRVMAALCRHLLQGADLIGLNVKADNEAALACYRSLGFDAVAPYDQSFAELA